MPLWHLRQRAFDDSCIYLLTFLNRFLWKVIPEFQSFCSFSRNFSSSAFLVLFRVNIVLKPLVMIGRHWFKLLTLFSEGFSTWWRCSGRRRRIRKLAPPPTGSWTRSRCGASSICSSSSHRSGCIKVRFRKSFFYFELNYLFFSVSAN